MNVCPQDSKITPCTGQGDSDKWCCGDSDSCCKTNIGVITLPQVLGAGISLSSLSSSSVGGQTASAQIIKTATETALMSASPTAQTSPTDSVRNGDSINLARGIVAVVVIAAIAGVAGVVVGCWFVRRRLRRGQSQAMDEHGPVVISKVETDQAPMIHEVGVAEEKPELCSRSAPYELASEPCELDSSESRPGK